MKTGHIFLFSFLGLALLLIVAYLLYQSHIKAVTTAANVAANTGVLPVNGNVSQQQQTAQQAAINGIMPKGATYSQTQQANPAGVSNVAAAANLLSGLFTSLGNSGIFGNSGGTASPGDIASGAAIGGADSGIIAADPAASLNEVQVSDSPAAITDTLGYDYSGFGVDPALGLDNLA